MFKKLLKSVLALVLLTALASDPATAQDLILGTTGKVVNAGTISFKSADAKFTNNNPAVAIGDVYEGEDGIISFDNTITQGAFSMFDGDGTPLATTAAFRLPGTLRFNGVGVTQSIQDNLYIMDLVVDGDAASEVIFPNGQSIFVSGAYTLGTDPADRTYTANTFVYDGSINGTQDLLQGESYFTLHLTGSDTKVLPSQTLVAPDDNVANLANYIATTVTNEFRALATQSGMVSIQNQLTLEGTGVIESDGNNRDFYLGEDPTINDTHHGRIVLAANATLTIDEDASLTVRKGVVRVDGDADLVVDGTFALTDEENAIIDLAADADMIVNNSFTNAFGARTNMDFDEESTVTYNNATDQTIVSTATGKPYGNLVTTDGGLKIAEGNVHIATGLSVTGGNIDMNANDATLFVLNNAASINYAANEEVVGRMRHNYASVEGQTLKFNNEETEITYTDVTTAVDYFEILSLPGEEPLNYDDTKDLKRKVSLVYDGTNPNVTWTMKMGYQESDVNADNNWVIGYTESQLRMYESQNQAAPEDVEKMSTGNAYDRLDAGGGALGFVSLPGFIQTTANVDGTPDAGFLSGNDLVFRSGPAEFISINNGRWSNPGTWDEGVMPGPEDFALIQTTVHMGYVRSSDGWGSDGYTGADNEITTFIAEYGPADWNSGFISRITIDNIAGSSLLVGNNNDDDAVSLYVKDIAANALSGEVVVNNTTLAGAATVDGTNGDVSATEFNGFYVLRPEVTFSIKKNLTSEGNIGNAGTIEIGD